MWQISSTTDAYILTVTTIFHAPSAMRTMKDAILISSATDIVQPNLSRSLSKLSAAVRNAARVTKLPAHDSCHIVKSVSTAVVANGAPLTVVEYFEPSG